MGRSYYLRIAGVIENLSVYVDDTGREHAIFGRGGGAELAREIGVPLLGQVPIHPAISQGGDDGVPVVLADSPAGDELRRIVDTIVAEAVPPVALAGCSARMLEAAARALDALG